MCLSASLSEVEQGLANSAEVGGRGAGVEIESLVKLR